MDDVRGALNLDLGTGRHRLFISDEAATAGDPNVKITDVDPGVAGLSTGPEMIWVTGLSEGRNDANFSYYPNGGGISYKVAPTGNLYDGVVYWTGSGDDTITIDGTHVRAGERTTTLLNTGLGNDSITVASTPVRTISSRSTLPVAPPPTTRTWPVRSRSPWALQPMTTP